MCMVHVERTVHIVSALVVMSARAVHVTVRELFVRRSTDFGDLDIEIEILTGKRMVAIHRDHVADDVRHCHSARTLR